MTHNCPPGAWRGATPYDPERHLVLSFPEIRTIESTDLPAGMYGYTDFPARTIVLRSGLWEDEKRSTLTHEIIHLERGPAHEGAKQVEEEIVNLVAASRLVPAIALPGLDDAVQAHGEQCVAEALGVDMWTLEVARVLADAVRALLGKL